MDRNNELEVTTEYQDGFNQPTSVPRYDNINQGTVAVESSRAIAEAQGKLVIAKNFPRDEQLAYQKAIESCRRPEMAKTAFYSYPRGGSQVSGPSIKFAQELARCWGNLDYGIKELSRDKDKSEMQAYCWDLESNTISVQNFTNPHQREVKGQMQKLSSDRDIYETNANMGARRLRSRILAVLPDWLVNECVAECKRTAAGNTSIPLIDRVRAMLVKFADFSITKEMLEKKLGHTIETTSQDEFVDLIGIYNSLKDGQSSVSDWFERPKQRSKLNDLLEKELSKGDKKDE